NYWQKIINLTFADNKFEAIHLHDLPLAQVAAKFAKKYQIPFVLDLHENRPEIMREYRHVNTFPGRYLSSIRAWKNYEEKYLKIADRVIVVTREAAQYYGQRFLLPEAKIFVVQNYTASEEFLKLAEKSEKISKYADKFLLVYFGDTGLRRGTATIIAAANLLRAQPEIHFLIIGDSKEQQLLHKMVQNLQLQNVELTGWLALPEAISYIKVADIGLCPFLRNIHHDTTFANKMFQYLALGIPVLVSDCVAQKRVVQEEKCGLIFKAGEAEDLQRKIQKMQKSTDYKLWRRNATNMTQSKYDWQVASLNLRKVYESL
ncbi:MAG: glycosyltransferase family 4 protein, partial [Candidatus Cloacimonadales bacterium]